MNTESEIPTVVFTDISEELTASILSSKQFQKSRLTIKIGYITYITINGVGSQWEWQW